MIEFVLILCLAVLGRMAGGWKLPVIASPLIGLIIGYIIVGLEWLPLLLSGVAGWLGEKPGVGHPKGYIYRMSKGRAPEGTVFEYGRLERWQPKMLRFHPYLSLALRGAIWGAAYLPLVYFDWRFACLVPAYAVSMPAAIWLGQHMPSINGFAKNAWEWSESLQQVMVAIFLNCYILSSSLLSAAILESGMDYRKYANYQEVAEQIKCGRINDCYIEDGDNVLNRPGRFYLVFTGPDDYEVWYRENERWPMPTFMSLDRIYDALAYYGFEEFTVKVKPKYLPDFGHLVQLSDKKPKYRHPRRHHQKREDI